MPPSALRRGLRLVRRAEAPVEASFAAWLDGLAGAEAAALTAAAAGVAVFHSDPGSLSAAFVAERLRRVFSLPPAVRYRVGGWGGVIESLAEYARSLGVRIELGSRVTELGSGVTIVATDLEAARRLLGDATLSWPSGRAALLDLGLRRDRRDAFVISDLAGAGWLETFTVPDPSLAPAGEHLVQMQMPIGPEETKADGVARLEAIADLALPGWRERTTYRSSAMAAGRTGAVDPPGASWRDRPAIDRGDGVFLVGDRVAAPGLLSEVSLVSAIRAARAAVGDSVRFDRGARPRSRPLDSSRPC
jgi:phytoene dehydrogenase-like protein